MLSKSDARFLPRLANKLGKGKGRKRREGGELGGREIIRQRPTAACAFAFRTETRVQDLDSRIYILDHDWTSCVQSRRK